VKLADEHLLLLGELDPSARLPATPRLALGLRFGDTREQAILHTGEALLHILGARWSWAEHQKLKTTETAATLGDLHKRLECAPKGALRSSELWGNPKTLEDHFIRHGADFGAQSADDYVQQASRFLQRSQLDNLPTKVDAKGVIRVYDPKTNTFGSFNPDGTIKTFYKPDPNLHPYPTNLDYWNAQPGVSPWTP
jgi:hypothetical protein